MTFTQSKPNENYKKATFLIFTSQHDEKLSAFHGMPENVEKILEEYFYHNNILEDFSVLNIMSMQGVNLSIYYKIPSAYWRLEWRNN